MQHDAISRAIQLSLLEKNDEEQKALYKDVENILDFIADVRKLSATTESGTRQRVNVFREDVVTVPAGTYREQILANAPKHFRHWFLSKKILP